MRSTVSRRSFSSSARLGAFALARRGERVERAIEHVEQGGLQQVRVHLGLLQYAGKTQQVGELDRQAREAGFQIERQLGQPRQHTRIDLQRFTAGIATQAHRDIHLAA